VVVEEIKIVLGADVLIKRFSPALMAHNCGPRLIECVRIIHCDLHFQQLAAVEEMPALDYVDFFAVRGAEGVDHGFCVLADGVDHKRIALVMADRFSVPGRFDGA